MYGGGEPGASAVYHNKVTRTGSIAAHITNSISADLACCCALPLTLPPWGCYIRQYGGNSRGVRESYYSASILPV